ncbi:Dabb family protein [Pseudonocardia sp. GCM10023141]|uniref:Dabb family protein n=1 Tax=Pseudonocardia sp. GCM10023141 TaxID=3252653 RepID=UPI00360E4844
MLIHCVTVIFKESATSERVAAFDVALAALPAQIELIRETRHGRDLGERPTNADYALVTAFDDANAFHAYLEHPAHQAVVRDHLAPLADSFHSTQFLVAD